MVQTYDPYRAMGLVAPGIQCQQNVIRVNGKNEAESYRMMPNSSVLLLDETQPFVYLKTSDGAGYGTVKTFKIIPVDEQTKEAVNDRFASFEARLTALEASINATKSNNNGFKQQKQSYATEPNSNGSIKS